MSILNEREWVKLEQPPRKRVHVLVKFPEDWLESVVVQWAGFKPTMLVQPKTEPSESLQALGRSGGVLDRPLRGFLDPSNGRAFEGEAYRADLLFSERAFAALQPEADLVLSAESLWECRAEALSALKLADEPWTPPVQ